MTAQVHNIHTDSADVSNVSSAPSKSWWLKTLHIGLGLVAKLVGAVINVTATLYRAAFLTCVMAAMVVSYLLTAAGRKLNTDKVQAVKLLAKTKWWDAKAFVATTAKHTWAAFDLKNWALWTSGTIALCGGAGALMGASLSTILVSSALALPSAFVLAMLAGAILTLKSEWTEINDEADNLSSMYLLNGLMA